MIKHKIKLGLCVRNKLRLNRKQKESNVVTKKQFQYQYEAFSREVPIPGLKEIVISSNKMFKWSWIICIAVFLALTIYFLTYTGIKYYADETTTKVCNKITNYIMILTKNHQSQIYLQVTLKKFSFYNFPPVYVCFHGNWLNDNLLLAEGLSNYGLEYLKYLIQENVTRMSATFYKLGKEDFHSFFHSKNYIYLVNFLIAYSWNNEQLVPAQNDVTSTTIVYVPGISQTCIKILLNSVKSSGKKSAVKTVMLNMPNNNNNSKDVTMFVGSDPTSVDANDLYRLDSGSSYDVFINAKNRTILNTRFNPCNESTNYDQEVCLYNCTYEYCAKHTNSNGCQCSTTVTNYKFQFNESTKLNYCQPRLINNKDNSTIEHSLLNNSIDDGYDIKNPLTNDTTEDNIDDNCQKVCEQECNWMSYQTNIELWSPDNNKNNVILYFHMEYRQGIETMEEVRTYTWESVTSDIGGQLSLWMGFSVVTLVQIVFYFVNSFFRRRKMTMAMNKRSKVSTVSTRV